MKKVAGSLRLDMANYRSLAAFAQFGTSDLDASTRAQIERGQVMTELLKQPQYSPLKVSEQIAVLWAGSEGLIDDVPVDRVREWEEKFLETLSTSHSDLMAELQDKKELTEEIVAGLTKAVKDFNATNSFAADEAAV